MSMPIRNKLIIFVLSAPLSVSVLSATPTSVISSSPTALRTSVSASDHAPPAKPYTLAHHPTLARAVCLPLTYKH